MPRIYELDTLTGSLSDSHYFAIDSGNRTQKVSFGTMVRDINQSVTLPWFGTQAQYNALGTYDPARQYYILED